MGYPNVINTDMTLIEWLNHHKQLKHTVQHFLSADEGEGELRGFMCHETHEIFIFDWIIKERLVINEE